MSETLLCPICTMTDIIDSDELHECQTCGHEWAKEVEDGTLEATDANGNTLVTGDNATVVKDLKVKGSSMVLKVGTKVKGIVIVPGDHEIEAKVDGRSVMIKAKFLRKT